MSTPYQTPVTLDSVREYVTAQPAQNNRSEHTLLLTVKHNNLKKTRLAEIRLDGRCTIDEVKQRLYLHTGTRPATMRLLLQCYDGVKELENDALTLHNVGATSGDTLLIVDDDPHSVSANGWLEDTGLVKRYVMPDEVYDKKENTYRKFKQRMREKDPTWSMTSALAKNLNAQNRRDERDFSEEKPAICVGERVEVFPGGKRGEVRFVGRDLHQMPEGWWVGVCYDEPVGKNDGCVKGVRYFEAVQGYGGLVRPSKVTVGDFPVLEDVDESEDEI